MFCSKKVRQMSLQVIGLGKCDFTEVGGMVVTAAQVHRTNSIAIDELYSSSSIRFKERISTRQMIFVYRKMLTYLACKECRNQIICRKFRFEIGRKYLQMLRPK